MNQHLFSETPVSHWAVGSERGQEERPTWVNLLMRSAAALCRLQLALFSIHPKKHAESFNKSGTHLHSSYACLLGIQMYENVCTTIFTCSSHMLATDYTLEMQPTDVKSHMPQELLKQ